MWKRWILLASQIWNGIYIFLLFLMSEKLRDSLYSFSCASLCFQPTAKTTEPMPKWSGVFTRQLTCLKCLGTHFQINKLQEALSPGIKKCALFTQNFEILRISWRYWGSPLKLERLLLSGKISPQMVSWDTLIWRSIDSYPYTKLQHFWSPALWTGIIG